MTVRIGLIFIRDCMNNSVIFVRDRTNGNGHIIIKLYGVQNIIGTLMVHWHLLPCIIQTAGIIKIVIKQLKD